ncbi:MAG: urea ABC transporter permease subunit UrtC [Proteobacteria bacterium]|nr:urea ABC transporter permease subunit UrtC [Pseudomonadota bacterium]
MLIRKRLEQKAEFGFAALIVMLAVYMPVSHYLFPRGSGLSLSLFSINLIGQIMSFGLLALALDLVWGMAGMLSLGHGIFFGIGGYMMGMYLLNVSYAETHVLPDFMQYMGWSAFPPLWHLVSSFGSMLILSVLLVIVVATLFGFVTFRSRINGVYFSIITQALTYALMLLLFINDVGLGGNNGLTGFTRILGFPLSSVSTQIGLAVVACLVLATAYLLLRFLAASSLGRALVAIRDDEARMRFLGYKTHVLKLFAWGLSAVLAALAGMLYVPQIGIVNPTIVSPGLSIEIAVWVAIGGRGTLIGAIIGAILVNGLKFWLTAAAPSIWPFILAGVTLIITIAMGRGLWGETRFALLRLSR